MPNCAVPSCKRFPSEGHHIAYNPPLVVGLCAIHHREITRVNQNFARNSENWEKLTSGKRRPIWDVGLNQKIKNPTAHRVIGMTTIESCMDRTLLAIATVQTA